MQPKPCVQPARRRPQLRPSFVTKYQTQALAAVYIPAWQEIHNINYWHLLAYACLGQEVLRSYFRELPKTSQELRITVVMDGHEIIGLYNVKTILTDNSI